MNIYEKLIAIRATVDYIQKKNTGPQYKYVSSSQTLEAVRGEMNKQKLLLVPRILEHDVRGDTVVRVDQYGEKHTTTWFTELVMEYEWINAENPEETLKVPWYGQGVDIAGEKGVGKALTYAEKYFLLKFFNVPTDKDDPDAHQADERITPKGGGKSLPTLGKGVPTPASVDEEDEEGFPVSPARQNYITQCWKHQSDWRVDKFGKLYHPNSDGSFCKFEAQAKAELFELAKGAFMTTEDLKLWIKNNFSGKTWSTLTSIEKVQLLDQIEQVKQTLDEKAA